MRTSGSFGHHLFLMIFNELLEHYFGKLPFVTQIDLIAQPSAIELAAGGEVLGVVFGEEGAALWRIDASVQAILDDSGISYGRVRGGAIVPNTPAPRRLLGHTCLEQTVNGEPFRVIKVRTIPIHQQLLSFIGAQHRQRTDLTIGIIDHAFKQRKKMFCNLVNGFGNVILPVKVEPQAKLTANTDRGRKCIVGPLNRLHTCDSQ